MNEKLLKTSGTDVLSSRKKLRKTFLGVANLVDPWRFSPALEVGARKRALWTRLEGGIPHPSLYVRGLKGFDFYLIWSILNGATLKTSNSNNITQRWTWL